MRLSGIVGGERIDEGVVVSRSSHTAIVEIGGPCNDSEVCSSCEARGGCANTRRPERVEVMGIDENSDLQVGSPVRVRRYAVNEGFAAVTVFGTPIVGALAALGMWTYGFGGDPESLGGVMAGIAGTSIGFALAAAVNWTLMHRLSGPSLVSGTQVRPFTDGGGKGSAPADKE